MGLGGICGAEGAVVGLEGSLWGWGGSYGAAVGLEGVLWGWGRFYSSGGRGSLKPMGRPDGRRAAVGLGRICGAGRDLWG